MTAPRGVREGVVEERVFDVSSRSRARRLALEIGLLLIAVLLIGVFTGGSSGLAPADARHSSFGVAAADHKALFRVLQLLDRAPERLESSYGSLPAANAHLLVTLDPLMPGELEQDPASRLDTAQLRALREWIEAGGRWLVGWRADRSVEFFGRRVQVDELVPQATVGQVEDDPFSLLSPLPSVARVPARGWLRGEGPLAGLRVHLALEPRDARVVPSELAAAEADAERGGDPADQAPTMRVFEEPLPEGCEVLLRLGSAPLLVRRSIGQGEAVLASTVLPFTNAGLGLLDLGPVAVAVLHELTDRGRRRVLVDEFCHGFVQARGMLWWARERRFFDPLVAFVVLLVLLGWRGAVAVAPAVAPLRTRRRAVEEFVVALADIARRAGRRGRAATNLLEIHELLARDRRDAEALGRLRVLRDELSAERPDNAERLCAFARRAAGAARPEPPRTSPGAAP